MISTNTSASTNGNTTAKSSQKTEEVTFSTVGLLTTSETNKADSSNSLQPVLPTSYTISINNSTSANANISSTQSQNVITSASLYNNSEPSASTEAGVDVIKFYTEAAVTNNTETTTTFSLQIVSASSIPLSDTGTIQMSNTTISAAIPTTLNISTYYKPSDKTVSAAINSSTQNDYGQTIIQNIIENSATMGTSTNVDNFTNTLYDIAFITMGSVTSNTETEKSVFSENTIYPNLTIINTISPDSTINITLTETQLTVSTMPSEKSLSISTFTTLNPLNSNLPTSDTVITQSGETMALHASTNPMSSTNFASTNVLPSTTPAMMILDSTHLSITSTTMSLTATAAAESPSTLLRSRQFTSGTLRGGRLSKNEKQIISFLGYIGKPFYFKENWRL